MDIIHPLALGMLIGSDATGIEIWTVKDDLRAESLHGGDFEGVGVFRHVDDGADAEFAGGEGDRLTVIAGGGGDDTFGANLRGKIGHEVETAADFEGADRLKVLALEIDV